MKIAIISDIHSNTHALQKALREIEKLQIDKIYCLGDIVGYGANPNECIELLRKHSVTCLLGNHDVAVIETTLARYFTKPGRQAAEWTAKVLTEENRDFISRLPYRVELDGLTLVHASPAQPELWQYILSLQDALPQFEHFSTRLCFIGHTHIPFICGEDLKTFTFKKGIRYLINVGSVGQSRDGNPQLSFGLLDTDAWSYENIRADYDIAGAAEAIISNKLPRILADRLFRGV